MHHSITRTDRESAVTYTCIHTYIQYSGGSWSGPEFLFYKLLLSVGVTFTHRSNATDSPPITVGTNGKSQGAAQDLQSVLGLQIQSRHLALAGSPLPLQIAVMCSCSFTNCCHDNLWSAAPHTIMELRNSLVLLCDHYLSNKKHYWRWTCVMSFVLFEYDNDFYYS